MATSRRSQDKRARIERTLDTLRALFERCRVCGRRCGANRTAGALGFCNAPSDGGETLRYSSAPLHFGEEPVLVGRGGSGTVFFSHCNLRCIFCQNYQISHEGLGETLSYSELAEIFLMQQRRGAENINLVTPTHYIYPIMLALREAVAGGLELPLVYNTNGFETLELLAVLDGIVDVYLPDMKYSEPEPAQAYSSAKDYPEVARAAIREMYRQTGPVILENGVAQRGTIIRHLVLPEDASGSYAFLLWLKDEGMTDVTLSLMSQYSPQYEACRHPVLGRRITAKEYEDVVQYAVDLGFEHLLVQSTASQDVYLPDFREEEPFE